MCCTNTRDGSYLFLKVTHHLGPPQGAFDPLDAQGRRVSKFNVYTMLAVKTYDENRKSENIFMLS